MSGNPRENDRLVDALLAAHQVPALNDEFADRVLAAAQSSRGSQVNGLPRWRRRLRPWRRSPFLLGFLALNIVAASAVAAMVTGIPVWHHVTEIVEKVTHSWHRQPVHSLRQVVPPRLAKLQASGFSPVIISSIASKPKTAAVVSPKTGESAKQPNARETVRLLRQTYTQPLAISGQDNRRDRIAQHRRRENLKRHRPNKPFEIYPNPVRSAGPPIEARPNPLEDIPRARQDWPVRDKIPPAVALPREPRPVASQPAERYGPRLEPQRAHPERQIRAVGPFPVAHKARSERRRLRPFDQRQGRARRASQIRRFKF